MTTPETVHYLSDSDCLRRHSRSVGTVMVEIRGPLVYSSPRVKRQKNENEFHLVEVRAEWNSNISGLGGENLRANDGCNMVH